MDFRRCLFLIFIFFSLVSVPIWGQFLDLDPKLAWHVLQTKHFKIIYHKTLEAIAQEAALVSEEAYEFWVKELKYAVPTEMNIILADTADFAVGAANGFGDVIAGVSHVRAFNEWLNPQNRSWFDDVLYHEIGHIFDINKISGLSQRLRPWLGPALTLPNRSKPGMIIEGIPIYFELKRTGASRSNSSRDAMYFRIQVLEDSFVPFDQMSSSSGYERNRWPSGYMLAHDGGAWFARFVAERYGVDKLAIIDEVNADVSLISLFSLGLVNDFETVMKKALGVSAQELEASWRAWLTAQFEPQLDRIRTEGITSSQKLGHLSYWNSDPAWAPDGKWIYYYHKDMIREASIHRITPDGKDDGFITGVPFELDFFRPPFFATAPQISPDGEKLLYTKHEIFDNHYIYADLFLWSIKEKKEERLTQRARSYHPVFFPDGERILFAQQRDGAEPPTLAVYEVDADRIVPFKTFPKGTLLDSFAISPNGKQIALTLWKMGGYQDLYLMSTDGGELIPITQDKSGDFDPEWSPDGSYILFSAERDDVYNLYAYHLSDGQFFKVTNVLTGAFAPAVSPDSKKIAFISYSSKGYELHLMDYHPGNWRSVRFTKELIPDWQGWRQVDLKPQPYRAEEFLQPRLWLPIPNPLQPAILLMGFDPLGDHNYTLYAGLDLKGRQLVFSVDYVAQFALKTDLRFLSWLEDAVNSLSPRFTLHAEDRAQDELVGSAELELTLSRHIGRVQTLALGVEHRQADTKVQKLAIRYEESSEGGSDLSRIGRDLSLQVEFVSKNSRWGRVFQMRQQERLRLPFTFDNRLGRVTAMSLSELEPLQVGGAIGPWPLRGFPARFKQATQIIYSSWELEFPLFSIERGLGLWSILFDRVDGALFTEGARLSTKLIGKSEACFSYGAELRWTVVLGYSLPVQLRFGVAQGEGQPGPEFYVDIDEGF